MRMPEITLVTFTLCPYVQRSIITLEEKGIAYTRTDIDLSNKPQWFTELSPLGKVPLLIIDGATPIFESAVICEFLDEITPDSLLPENPFDRAHHRSWIEFGSQILHLVAKLYSAKTKIDYDNSLVDLRTRFELLEQQVQSKPFFTGEKFSLIDAVYAPIFRYFDVFELYLNMRLFHDLSNTSAWRKNLMRRHSVKKAVREDYPDLLTKFLMKKDSYMSELISTNMN